MSNTNKSVAVYAVCKNEEKNIIEWYESVKDADFIVLLDTGSTDNTISIAKNLGINVLECIISPWDETLAKNIAMSFIPKDISYCFILDLDRRIIDKDWVDKVKSLKGDYNSIMVNVIDLVPLSNNNFTFNKHPIIHSRFGCQWISYRPQLFFYEGNNSTFLDISVLNVAGDKDRYSNREPLYENTYKFFYNKEKYSEYLSLNLLCNYALSAFENNNLNLTNSLFLEILKRMSVDKDKQYISSVGLTSLFIAQSLLFPNKSIDFLLLGLKEKECIEKKIFFIRLAIIYYYKNDIKLCKKYLDLFHSYGIEFDKDFIFCKKTTLNIFYLLKKFCNNAQLSDLENKEIFKYYSYILVGKERPELVDKFIKNLNMVL